MKNKEIHPFINLELGEIEQYSKIVSLAEVDQYKKEGWLTYEEIDLEEGDEDAYMLYGELNKSVETLMFNNPKCLQDVPLDILEGKEITGFSTHLGTYGMGGPGFFGLLLNDKDYLVFAKWNSSAMVFVEERPVVSNPNQYEIARPWVSNFGGELTWDELSDILIGAVVTQAQVEKDKLTIRVTHNSKDFLIEYRLVKASENDTISQVVVFQDKEAVLIV